MHGKTEPQDIAPLFEAAWNAHDMTVFGALFHPDATFVNRFSAYWRGHDAILDGHRFIHETVYRDSVLKVDAPDVDMIGDDVAILHFWTRLQAGPAHPAGPHQVDTLIMAVATRREGVWQIQAGENVTYLDPRTGKGLLRDPTQD
ncbi:MAG: DUF4440 domain-containing protein [Sphingobium sp.]|nr:DUF4440 domain-containing protein [Sphingobium sp.]